MNNFQDFWPHYVRQHLNPTSRLLHFVGMSLAVYFIISAAVGSDPWALLYALGAGYGLSFLGHWFEGNKPASFGHPIWSLRAGWKMWRVTLCGDMDRHIKDATQDDWRGV